VPIKILAIEPSAKLIALAIIISSLASCSHDNRAEDIQRCTGLARQEASNGNLLNLSGDDNIEERHDKIGAAVSDCMSKIGYPV